MIAPKAGRVPSPPKTTRLHILLLTLYDIVASRIERACVIIVFRRGRTTFKTDGSARVKACFRVSTISILAAANNSISGHYNSAYFVRVEKFPQPSFLRFHGRSQGHRNDVTPSSTLYRCSMTQVNYTHTHTHTLSTNTRAPKRSKSLRLGVPISLHIQYYSVLQKYIFRFVCNGNQQTYARSYACPLSCFRGETIEEKIEKKPKDLDGKQ